MFNVKFVDLLTTHQMPFAVCRSDVCFFRYEGGGEKAPRPESNLSEPFAMFDGADTDTFQAVNSKWILFAIFALLEAGAIIGHVMVTLLFMPYANTIYALNIILNKNCEQC